MLATFITLALHSVSSQAATVPNNVTLAEDQNFVRGNGAEPESLDPGLIGSGGPDEIIVNDMFEGLVLENGLGETIPGQAVSWSISEDQKKITFQLREGITWSNGDAITADDFVFAWQRAIDPKTGNTTSFYFETANVQNASDIISGKKAPSELGIKALDNRTLEITLSQPTPYFVSLMTVKTFYPVPKAIVEKYGNNWMRESNIVTNGAYTLSRWVPNEYIEVTRNEKYWDNENTVINQVTYLGLSSQNAEYTRYQAGEIDMTNRVQLEQYQRLIKENPEQIDALPLLGSYVYSFNHNKPPFNNVVLRKALNMAIDRNILVNKITGQGEKAAHSVVPNVIPGYEGPVPAYSTLSMKERVKEAEALLKSEGYDSSNPLTFTLLYNTSENHKKIAIALASMWKPLGVKVDLENMEWNAYKSAKSLGDFQIVRSFAFGDYLEPSSILASFTCHHVENESGYCNDKFDALMTQAANTPDRSDRFELFSQAETLLIEDSVALPLYQYNHTRLIRPTLKGFPENNPKGNIYAKDMYFISAK
ncbi:peptide ABC transporter substrate-binding protein [Vibrio sp.]|nr:peptide ABC transporter substrate-binding protein [Vibrio sp.]